MGEGETVCIVLAIMALQVLLFVKACYAVFVLGFSVEAFRMLRTLSAYDETEFCTNDVLVAAEMHSDMRVIHVLRQSLQVDIVSVILVYLLETKPHGARPR